MRPGSDRGWRCRPASRASARAVPRSSTPRFDPPPITAVRVLTRDINGLTLTVLGALPGSGGDLSVIGQRPGVVAAFRGTLVLWTCPGAYAVRTVLDESPRVMCWDELEQANIGSLLLWSNSYLTATRRDGIYGERVVAIL